MRNKIYDHVQEVVCLEIRKECLIMGSYHAFPMNMNEDAKHALINGNIAFHSTYISVHTYFSNFPVVTYTDFLASNQIASLTGWTSSKCSEYSFWLWLTASTALASHIDVDKVYFEH